MSAAAARFPYPAAITAYGGGGFRFADMSHRGSILCLPSGVYAWTVADAAALTIEDFARPLAELTAPGVLLFGAGKAQTWPDQTIFAAFADAGVGFECMSTGAAARTYNVLLAEGRAVGAALIAVE